MSIWKVVEVDVYDCPVQWIRADGTLLVRWGQGVFTAYAPNGSRLFKLEEFDSLAEAKGRVDECLSTGRWTG